MLTLRGRVPPAPDLSVDVAEPMADDTTLRSFLRGLLTPSIVSTMSGLFTACALGLAAVVIVPALLRSEHHALFSISPRDHELFVTSRLLRLASHETQTPAVAIIGASVTQSSFGTMGEISEAIDAAGGALTEVISLTSVRQNLNEHLLMIDRLPLDRPVVAVIGVGPLRFARTREEYIQDADAQDFGVTSPAYENALGVLRNRARLRTGIALLDQPLFYARRYARPVVNGIRLLRGQTIAQNEETFLGKSFGPEEFDRKSRLVAARYAVPDALLLENYARLRAIIEAAPPNVTVVLFEHPIHPKFVDTYLGQDKYDVHVGRMRALASDLNVPYWTLGLDVALGDDAFADWAHIGTETAQERLRKAFVDRLMELDVELERE